MNITGFKVLERKVIIKLKDRICETAIELLESSMFREILERCLSELQKRNSRLLGVIEHKPTASNITLLAKTLLALTKSSGQDVLKLVPGSAIILRDSGLLRDFVEYLYNYWRNFDRFIICDSQNDHLDQKPYRTFSATIEKLMHLIRAVYRDIQANVNGANFRIYRQVVSGAELGTIAKAQNIPYPAQYAKLNTIPTIRQIIVYPPLVINQQCNKRSGKFERIEHNPLENFNFKSDEWLCYPAKVGDLLIHVYINEKFYELGFSMCNLFEIADDEQLQRKPDAIYAFGVPEELTKTWQTKNQTIFYDDTVNNLLVGAVPYKPEFGYFGYLKKMILTLHNIVKLKQDHLPYHGSMITINLQNNKQASILIIGDTGTGKSETLEAFRSIAADQIEDITIVADDMGSLAIDKNGEVLSYGTEIGAFLRLDDLPPGHAFGQMDRTIIMNPSQVNARIIIPVTTIDAVLKGTKVDYVLYANNYEQTDEEHPVIDQFKSAESAMTVFREGTSMSKGTTTSTGLTHSYYANPFGAPQYRELHEPLADKFFKQFFKQKVFVAQMRSRLGIPGFEQKGPEEAARKLLEIIINN